MKTGLYVSRLISQCLLFAGTHWLIISLSTGLAVFFAAVIATVIAVNAIQAERVSEQHVEILSVGDQIIKEQTETLWLLNSNYMPSCDEKGLLYLRKLQFTKRYINDIGIMDNNNRLLCTTGLGKIDFPIKFPNPHREMHGYQYWWNLQIPITDYKMRTGVKKLGSYVSFVDYNVNLDLISKIRQNKFINALSWGPSGKALIIISNNKNIELIQENLNGKVKNTNISEYFKCRDYVVTKSGDELYKLHSVVNCIDSIRENLRTTLLFLTIGLLFSLLISFAMLPRLKILSRSKYRLRHLCRHENIICHYQSVIDMHTNEIVGCEVLVRIKDGNSILYPDKILKDISDQKMTWALDSIISSKALYELNKNIHPNKPFRVAINLFPEDINYEILSKHFSDILINCNNYFRIGIEVTEHSISEKIIYEIQKIKQTGYEIMVDDFGTGYSNLGIVKKIQPDIIKIDKSFVFEMEESSVRSSMIPQIIDIASAVGAGVIAEGVENSEQRDLLIMLGVQYAQGYFFGRPMPIADFARLYHQQPPQHAAQSVDRMPLLHGVAQL